MEFQIYVGDLLKGKLGEQYHVDSQVCSKNLERLNADDHGLVPMVWTDFQLIRLGKSVPWFSPKYMEFGVSK